MKFFLYLVGFALFIMATFVNDFNIDGFPVFYFIWLSLVLFRLLMNIDFQPMELLSQLILFFLLLPSFFVEIYGSDGFYIHAYFFSVLYINAVLLIPYLIYNYKYLRIAVALYLAVLAGISLLTMIQGANRATIFFGPNVLYRIYGLLFALFLLSYVYEKKFFLSKGFFWVVFIMFVTGLLATGSRGAVIVFAIPMIYLLIRKNVFRVKTRHILLALAPALAILLYFVIDNYNLFWRLFYFDFGNESITARLEYFSTAKDYILKGTFNINYIFGLSSSNYLWDNYPHNFIIEAFVYGGVWLTLIVMLPMLIFIYNSMFSNEVRYIIFFFTYLPIFIGASVSGDLTYNFPVISVPFVAMIYTLSNAGETYVAGVSEISRVRWKGLAARNNS